MVVGLLMAVSPAVVQLYFRSQQSRLVSEWSAAKKKVESVETRTAPVEAPVLGSITTGPAILDIEDIGLKVAVVSGTSQLDLAKGPGLINSTSRPGEEGNVAIAGHRTMYGAPFRRLHELRAGDELVLKLPDADLLYVIRKTGRVKPSDSSVLDSFGDNRLTLISCDPPFSAKFRLVVVGRFKNILQR